MDTFVADDQSQVLLMSTGVGAFGYGGSNTARIQLFILSLLQLLGSASRQQIGCTFSNHNGIRALKAMQFVGFQGWVRRARLWLLVISYWALLK